MGQLESLRKLTLHSLFRKKKKKRKKKEKERRTFAYAFVVLSDGNPNEF
jgi:hypothetical protein